MPRNLGNVPSDWDAYYRTCPACGTTWHDSEGGGCPLCAAQEEYAQEQAEIEELKGLLSDLKGSDNA